MITPSLRGQCERLYGAMLNPTQEEAVAKYAEMCARTGNFNDPKAVLLTLLDVLGNKKTPVVEEYTAETVLESRNLDSIDQEVSTEYVATETTNDVQEEGQAQELAPPTQPPLPAPAPPKPPVEPKFVPEVGKQAIYTDPKTGVSELVTILRRKRRGWMRVKSISEGWERSVGGKRLSKVE